MWTDVPLNAVQTSKDVALVGAQTATAIWTPASGKRLLITSIAFTVSADATVKIFRGSDADGKRFFNQLFAMKSGAALPYIPPFLCLADEALKVTTDAGNINITVTGAEV